MATARRRWPKAANEIRSDAIMEAGEIRGHVRAIRGQLEELDRAVQNRDFRIARAIAASLSALLSTVDKAAEIIVVKLENAPADEEE